MVPIEPTKLSGGMWLQHAPVSQQRTVTGIHRITGSMTSRLTPQPVLRFTPLHSCGESSQLFIKFGGRFLPKEQNFIENLRGVLLVTETWWKDVSFCGDWDRLSVFLGWSWSRNYCLLVRNDLCGTELCPQVLGSATSQPEQFLLPLLPLSDLSPAGTSTVRVQGQVMNWIQCWTLSCVKNYPPKNVILKLISSHWFNEMNRGTAVKWKSVGRTGRWAKSRDLSAAKESVSGIAVYRPLNAN